MPKFDGPRERKSKDFRGNPSRRNPRSTNSFEDRPKRSFDDKPRDRRDSGRDSGKHFSRGKRARPEIELTEVTCSSCGKKCTVPFKPTSDKPIYCDECFGKKGGKNSSNRDRNDKGNSSPNDSSEKDFDMINEKLNKIMKALKIE